MKKTGVSVGDENNQPKQKLPSFSACDKLMFLNHELFYMIETSVDIHLLAYLYSSQLITKDTQTETSVFSGLSGFIA